MDLHAAIQDKEKDKISFSFFGGTTKPVLDCIVICWKTDCSYIQLLPRVSIVFSVVFFTLGSSGDRVRCCDSCCITFLFCKTNPHASLNDGKMKSNKLVLREQHTVPGVGWNAHVWGLLWSDIQYMALLCLCPRVGYSSVSLFRSVHLQKPTKLEEGWGEAKTEVHLLSWTRLEAVLQVNLGFLWQMVQDTQLVAGPLL